MGGYTPLFSRIVTSSIWGEDSDTRVVWVTMMALSDLHGVVEGSIPGLARTANVSVEACEKALKKFLGPDKYSRTKENEGRRIEEVSGGWRLLNFAKHRDEAKSRADYYRKYRKKFPPIPPSKQERTNNILHTTNSATSLQHSNDCAQQLQEHRNYTEKEVEDACWQLPAGAWRAYFDQFNAQGWIRANGQPIRNLQSHIARMWDKKRNTWVFEKDDTEQNRKGKLLPGDPSPFTGQSCCLCPKPAEMFVGHKAYCAVCYRKSL